MLSNTMTDKPVYSDIFVSDRDILTEDDQNALIHMRDQHRLDGRRHRIGFKPLLGWVQ